ncbi:hypothetical protein DFH08DRAFT_133764 [Mycena albidolilacea]|uniref:Uncharacterized protein n=1 Tax=Mycena albidolilacea TaxID=1033008 RepID=A0AAD7A441_9AGAR|nr:hypothetical protein DFH08DRAFT_133764 [Mycena albidolilacea]
MNATDDQSTPGLGPVVVNGLPILGTDQCEKHSTKGLERGYFYVAATPMSIFGSLGILKAGLITLVLATTASWWLDRKCEPSFGDPHRQGWFLNFTLPHRRGVL